MKRYLPIYLYGALIILSGVFMLFSQNGNLNAVKLTLGITLTIGAIIAFIAAFSRQRKQVQFAYHEMHALAMIVFGVSLLFFANSFGKLISFTSSLFIFYAVSEIIFCIWLFNLAEKVDHKIVMVRVLLAFVIGIGTVVAMSYTDYTLTIFGALFIMVGINIILYVPVMKVSQLNNNSKELAE